MLYATLLCTFCLVYIASAQTAYDAVPRWGQATVMINDVLFVYGGKTDQFNSYSYTSAPNNNEILSLSLSSSFNTSSTPWRLLSTNNASSTGPSLSWHTLSAFNTSCILLFGGQPGPNSPTVLVGLADSVYLLDVSDRDEPSWVTEPVSWANEPIRRIHHSSATSPVGSVYLVGGEKADSSNIGFSEHYIFDPSTPSFTLLPSDNGPPDITGQSTLMLSDGRLLVLGGYSPSSETLFPFSTIWVLDTSQSSASWSLVQISEGSLPAPRRAFAAAVIAGTKVLIHGGSDAALQNNFQDGWILDASQNPMVWTEIEALSQLGARRDHFAISYGSQVIFGFGYGATGGAPASLQIFSTDTGLFTTTFTPLSPSSSQTQTLPGPSQSSTTTSRSSTHTFTSVHPTGTPHPSTGPGGGSDKPIDGKRNNTTAVAVGTVFGVIGLLVVVGVGAHFMRRHRPQVDTRRFLSLNANDDDDGEMGQIPAVRSAQGPLTTGSRFGILNTLGLAAVITTATRSRNVRRASDRRDMLADEDTRDFGAWYGARRQEGTSDSSWSLRSIIGPRKRSREPSVAGSTGAASWKEKADPFSDEAALMASEGTGYSGTLRPYERRQSSYTNTRSYYDPFTDPIEEEQFYNHNDEDDGLTPTPPYLHPLPRQLPTLRTILPVSQSGHPLTPLTERSSQNNLSVNTIPNSVSSHSTLHESPFDSFSHVTSHTSLDPPKSPVLFTTSIIGAPPTNKPIKRSDSWWSRFARTSFLDRGASESSREMPDFRDPNPAPRLIAIEERSPEGHSPTSQLSSSSQQGPLSVSRQPSMLRGLHNKSLSSVRTADTEAIEKMAGTMDVAQLIRSGSRRTVSTGTTVSLSIDTHQSSWNDGDYGPGAHGVPELMTFASPIEMTEVERFSHAAYATSAPVTSASSPSKSVPPTSSSVAARIQQFEGRKSHGEDTLLSSNTTKKRGQSVSVNYGLIPRASLFVANPDHKTNSSGDS